MKLFFLKGIVGHSDVTSKPVVRHTASVKRHTSTKSTVTAYDIIVESTDQRTPRLDNSLGCCSNGHHSLYM